MSCQSAPGSTPDYKAIHLYTLVPNSIPAFLFFFN
ncbi:unnamed protein product, partial [Staurois parvus]